jgi:hypothetical protein
MEDPWCIAGWLFVDWIPMEAAAGPEKNENECVCLGCADSDASASLKSLAGSQTQVGQRASCECFACLN